MLADQVGPSITIGPRATITAAGRARSQQGTAWKFGQSTWLQRYSDLLLLGSRSAATTLPTVKRILVFCGSSPGRLPDYSRAAGGTSAACWPSAIWRSVYGGASVGLMGALADRALAAGGTVIGVIPSQLVKHEIAHAGLTKLHIVETMHERKAFMAELSDGRDRPSRRHRNA